MKLNIIVALLLFAFLAVASAGRWGYPIRPRPHPIPIRPIPIRPIPILPRPIIIRPRPIPVFELPNHGDRFAAGIGGGTFGGYFKTHDTGRIGGSTYNFRSVNGGSIGNSKVGLYGNDRTLDG